MLAREKYFLDIVATSSHFFFAEATFGLEKVRCDVREGVGTLEVCVVVDPSIPSTPELSS